MPKVLILPHYQYESEFDNFLSEANRTQSDFKFYLLPPSDSGRNDSPLRKPLADYLDLLEFLGSQKKQIGLEKEDLLIAFYDGVITALDHGLVNLFIAGANREDLYPCTAAVSLQFISWGILEQKYDYSLQRHALFHLVMCSLIGSYTRVPAHHETYGCLLDFNNQLIDFNRKLQMGYYLCSCNQSGCYDAVRSERYGNSIIKLCKVLKEGIDHKKLQVIIQELIMGDRNIEIKEGNYNENIQGGYYEQSGNFGIGHMSGGEIKDGAKVGGVINEAEKQNLADAAQEIQQLLEQLSDTYPTTTSREKNIVVGEAVDRIEGNPTLKAKVINALKAGGTEAFKEAVDHPLVNIFVATIEGWQDAE